MIRRIKEFFITIHVIMTAREIQEFLWGNVGQACGFDEVKRMLRKRVIKLDEVSIENPYWKIEARKRLLQTAAICVKVIHKLDDGVYDGSVSNLPQYDEPLKGENETCQEQHH